MRHNSNDEPGSKIESILLNYGNGRANKNTETSVETVDGLEYDLFENGSNASKREKIDDSMDYNHYNCQIVIQFSKQYNHCSSKKEFFVF